MAVARAKNRQGDPGEPGKNAIQPNFEIGEVSSGTSARVWLTGTITKPILNFILPKGKQGDPGKKGDPGKEGTSKIISGGSFSAGSLNPIGVVIPAGQTKIVHSVLLADFFAIEYLFNIRKNDLTKTRSFKMLVHRLGAGIEDTIFARLGADLSYSISANAIGSNMELSITNNEAFDLYSTFLPTTI